MQRDKTLVQVNNFLLLHNLAISMITCLQWYNDSLSIRYALAVYSLYIRKQIAGRSLINRETQEYSEWKRLYSECRAIAQLMISECLANAERLQSEWIENAIRA